jgi:DNA polymerase-1
MTMLSCMLLGFKHINVWGDTQLLAHTINPEMPRKSMAFLQSIYTEEPYHKEEGGDFLGEIKKKAAKGYKSPGGSLDTLMLYNAKDAAVTIELHEEMLEEAREKGLEEYYHRCVMPRHKFYLEMERTGFKVDYDKRKELLDKYMKMYEQIHNHTEVVLGHELNVASPTQVAKCLYHELRLPMRLKRKKHPLEKDSPATDEDTITALLANQAKTEQQKVTLNNILIERKIRKTISTYILAKPDYDGRMRTSYNITGAETDRTSTSNISAPIRPEKSMGLGFQTLTKHGDIGSDICEMFVPDQGMVFINADLSQAEARVVFVLAEEWSTLEQVDNPKFDMHWQTALWVFAELPRTPEECKRTLSKEDGRRHVGKTTRHAGHLGATKKMLMQTINTDSKKLGLDLYVSEWRAGKFLDLFHEKVPNVRKIFHGGVEEALKSTRVLNGPTLIGPDGNKLPRGRYRMFFDRWSNELLKEAYAEIPQHTVSNQTKFAGIRIKKRIPNLQFVLEGHDALLVQCPIKDVDYVARIMKEEMETPIDFSSCTLKREFQLVIPADFQIGKKNYKDMERLKVD